MSLLYPIGRLDASCRPWKLGTNGGILADYCPLLAWLGPITPVQIDVKKLTIQTLNGEWDGD